MPTPFPIAYNINCEASHRGANRQAAVDEQIALHSAFTVTLNGYKSGFWFEKQIQARSPETQIAHRRYWAVDPHNPEAGGWDGSLHRAPGITADSILNTLQAEHTKHGIRNLIEVIYNEPSVHRHDKDPQGIELRLMLRLMVDCINGAAGRGMRVGVDIGQPVTLMQSELDDGFYDELFWTFARHPQMFLMIDEYALGDLWFNTSKSRLEYLTINKELARSHANYFTTAGSGNLQRDYIDDPSEAHLGRIEIVAQRCRKIGVPMPKTIYKEVGWDAVRLAQQNAVNAINGRLAMGYPTLAQYWNTRYPQWTTARTAFEQVKWLHRSMPDYIVGACLYGKDTSFENGAYHIEDAEFQRLLTDYSAEVRQGTVVPTPSPVVTPPTPPTSDAAWRAECRDLLDNATIALANATDAVRRARAAFDG